MANSRTVSDYIRQSANLVLVPLLILLSSLPQIMDVGRDIASQASTQNNPLVPLGLAFSIWGPIYLGIISYALFQALPSQGARDIHRRVGWWTALGFAGICGWTYFTSFGPMAWKDWGSALIFIPAALSLVWAMLILTRNRDRLSTLDRWILWLPISLIAGWMSIAQFLNFNSTLMPYFDAWGWSLTGSSVMMLGLAVWYVSFFVTRSGGNRAYVFPVLWGLSLLAAARVTGNKDIINMPIAIAAIVGVLILLLITIVKGRRVALAKL